MFDFESTVLARVACFFFYTWYNFVIIFATPFSGIWHIILLVVFFNNKKRNIRGTFYFTDGFINSLVTLVHTCKGKYKTCLILVPSSDVAFETFSVSRRIV